MPYLPPAE